MGMVFWSSDTQTQDVPEYIFFFTKIGKSKKQKRVLTLRRLSKQKVKTEKLTLTKQEARNYKILSTTHRLCLD